MSRPDEPKYFKGQMVQRVNQPDAVGVVVEARRDTQTDQWMYRVQFGSAARSVPESVIKPLEEAESPWASLFQGNLSGIDHFVFSLTYHRLRNPPTRIANSFATARTLFYPHQFIPLLKFLDNPGKRLLIADDVGLGKTIEAGYLLRELEAQTGLERVLVLVPARLVPKWQRELEDRFQEQFKPVKGADLVRQVERIQSNLELEPFRWIVSYESARSEEVRDAIEAVEFPLDLLIADEAHRMRNSETLQHRVGAALCRSADTVVFLSATPVQNRLEDLWNLFRLLEPDQFADMPVFQEQMEAHRQLIVAQQALAASPLDRRTALEAIGHFAFTSAGRSAFEREFMQSVLDRLASGDGTALDLPELQADIGRLSPVGHILSRTRKVEAMPNRPLREAQWTRVALTPGEQTVYAEVENICRAVYSGSDTSWGFQMSLLMAYRITASCIPAAIAYFSDKLRGASRDDSEIEVDPDDSESLNVWVSRLRDSFRRVVADYSEEGTVDRDSKLETLVEALATVWSEDDRNHRRRRKVVVFSFFRRTLEYLRAELAGRGIGVRMIHGGVRIADRETAIDAFLESPDVMVLLASEVGGEGLDLQRASVVVNYDLPWNPMVVEQRIGRVDRIGQQSNRIVVLNLVVEDSVEERVVQRLLDKIQIFRESIGEMDDVVGQEIERLTAHALRSDLTPEELDRQVEMTGEAIARRLRDARTILSRVDGLLAADQALVYEINSVVGERQIPGDRELFKFLNRFLASRYVGCQLPEACTRRVVEAHLAPVAADLEAAAPSLGDEAPGFARRVATGTPPVTLSREAAYTHLRSDLIHLQHPLTRFAVLKLKESHEVRQAAFALELESDRLPAGDYAFLLAAFFVGGHMPSTRFVPVIASLESGRVWNDVEVTRPIVVELLDRGRDLDPGDEEIDVPATVEERLLEGLEVVKAAWEERERKRQQAQRERQAAIRMATLEFRRSRAAQRYESLCERGAADFALKMAKARLEKAEKEIGTYLAAPPAVMWDGIEYEEVAVGILRIQEGQA